VHGDFRRDYFYPIKAGPKGESMSPINAWANAFLSFFYPEICQLCESRRAEPADGYVCNACRANARPVKPPLCSRCGLPFRGAITNEFECANCRTCDFQFSRARAPMEASGVVLEAIHRYKYQGALCLEPFLAGMLVEQAKPVLLAEQWDRIVPVPLHPKKKREREFNQAERLALCLGRALQIPVNTTALCRVKYTATQTRLARSRREDNMRGAFAVRAGRELMGKRIVLVDDVFTTGSTTNACASVLLQSGAAAVCVWTVARALL
jgi:ComF family protein